MSSDNSQEHHRSRPLNDRKLFASLKEINAASHTWQTELSTLLDSPPSIPQALQDAVAAQLKRKPQIEEIVHGSLHAMREVFKDDVKEHEWGAEVLVRLDLAWKQVSNAWPPDASKTDEALAKLRAVRDQLDEIIYVCMSITISPDINDRLPNLEIGQALDLEAVYGNGFPRDPAKRKLLIQELAQEQAVIHGGVFDPDSDVIYKIAPTKRAQRRSVWRMIGWLIAGGAALVAGEYFLGPLVPGGTAVHAVRTLILNYVFLFLGVIGHTVIDALKEQRSRPQSKFRAMDNWLLWLHVREAQVRASILWADLGFILLTTTLPNMDPKLAFAAGYGIDSITDLFLSRFEGAISQAASAIKPAAAPAAAAAAASAAGSH